MQAPRQAHDHAALDIKATMLLEDIPDAGADWRYRVRVAEGATSGWIEVEGTDDAPAPEAVEQWVSRVAADQDAGHRVRFLERRSPLAFEAD